MGEATVSHHSAACLEDDRREQLQKHVFLNGIDYVEVATDPTNDKQWVVHVYFIPKSGSGSTQLSDMLHALDGQPSKFTIAGGVRIRNIEVTDARRESDRIAVYVSEPGDFSTYTLRIDHAWRDEDDNGVPRLDPAFAECDFSFKASCPSRFDCRSKALADLEPHEHPVIDYMAKDYASFRQALLDLIPTLVPDWTERHEADLGIALVELLAYTGDQLSYYQDAVANEAFLETARQRISVRRHARLVDYRMHDGASARAFVHVEASGIGTVPERTPITTRITKPLGGAMPDSVIDNDLRGEAESTADVVFETMEAVAVHPDLNEIAIYTWGDRQCCLPRGTTSADLTGNLTACLEPSDFLLFEEVVDPTTGATADADPDHRQVVRLVEVQLEHDPLLDQPVTRVTWDPADGLAFPLCVSSLTERSNDPYEPKVSVARGNLVLADHGRSISGEVHAGPEAPCFEIQRRTHRVLLKEGQLSFQAPLPANGQDPATRLLDVDLQETEPQIRALEVSGTVPPDDWEAKDTLLESNRYAHHCVVETDNEGRALLRFGDDRHGQAPPDGSVITVEYRVGVGRAGNVGAGALAHLIQRKPADDLSSVRAVRNPLAAWGGIDPEPISLVKQLAPAAFHIEKRRAVTEDDYARAAERHPSVSKAVATFRWTGSWHTVFVTVDPAGRTDLPDWLEDEIRTWVSSFAQAGYDIEIDPPSFVPLDIEVDVCVAPVYFRAHIEEAVLEALGNYVNPTGQSGFFHPDRFTFGQPLYLSELCKAIEDVDGVDSVVVRKFHRFGKEPDGELADGRIPVGRLEVVRLDNDPNFPENGVLRLTMMGGK